MKNVYDYYLKRFCSHRAVFEEPVLFGDYVYATNSYIALKIHKKHLGDKYRTPEEITAEKEFKVPDIPKIFEEPPKPINGEILANFFNLLCGERIPISEEVCSHCGGEGYQHAGEFNGQSIYEACDYCDAGNVKAGQHESVDYQHEFNKEIDVRLAVPYLSIATEALAAFGESAFHVHSGKEHRAFTFNFSKGQILIMPLKK